VISISDVLLIGIGFVGNSGKKNVYEYLTVTWTTHPGLFAPGPGVQAGLPCGGPAKLVMDVMLDESSPIPETLDT
jgi:hypothetical protein